MSHIAFNQSRFACQSHQLTVVRGRLHSLRIARHISERRREVRVLKSSTTADFAGDLPAYRKHRRPIGLGVVQPGHEVGRAGTGDREASRELAGQLAVCRRGERGGSLMADPDKGKVAALLSRTHGISEAKIGVSYHPEDMGDAPVDHRFDHDVGDAQRPCHFMWKSHIHPVVANLCPVGRGRVGERSRRFPVLGRIVVAVPWTAEPAPFDRPLAERAGLMRAGIGQTAVATLSRVGDTEALMADGDRRDPALRQLVEAHEPVP